MSERLSAHRARQPAAPRPFTEPARLEDWRILAVLGPYRLLLVATLLSLYRSGFAPEFFQRLSAPAFYYGCLVYVIFALVLLLLGAYRRPGLRIQAHLHCLADTLTIGTLVYAAGGIGSGLGILLVPPVIGCSLVLSPRLAAVQAAVATLGMFAAETAQQLNTHAWDSSDYSQTGLLGLMFFASSLVANLVAQRARRSEAVAERVGSEFMNLSRLSESIIESMQTGVLVIDAEDRVRLANTAARRLLGDALTPGTTAARTMPALGEALTAWRAGRDDASLLLSGARSGRELTVRFTPLGWGAQTQVLVLLDDAAHLREQAQQMKLAALGRLSASIAHEIRNPLSAILQAGQLLSEAAEMRGENARLLEMIQRHGARIERIVRDVLDLSRPGPSQRMNLRLREWLIRTVAFYHESHPHTVRPIELDDVPGNVEVRFDPQHLQQVLFNLWDNSFEHGARIGRTVSVRLRASHSAEDGAVLLDVIDDGAGIPAELHERIFEPFFTTHTGGTGLGLFLCRELCEYNQARLSHVASATGATFRIRFGPTSNATVSRGHAPPSP